MPGPFNILLTRHSQAIHNQLKTKLLSQTDPSVDYKKQQNYINFKYSQQYIDRDQINTQDIQCILKQLGNDPQIQLIIISPLNRCIKTAKLLNEKLNAQIIVQPLITSRIIAAWSVGKSLQEKKKQYPELNFNYCQEQKIHWCVDLLIQDYKDFKDFYQQNKCSYQQPESFLLEYSKLYQGQTYRSIIQRSLKFKDKLIHIYSKLTQKNILIISHNNYLKVLTANRICKKGKARSDLVFDHGDLLYCSKEFFLQQDMLKFSNLQEKYKQGLQKEYVQDKKVKK